MDNRPENESKEKTPRLEMDCHQVPLWLPAVEREEKINQLFIGHEKKTLIMKHVVIDWTGTAIGWWTRKKNFSRSRAEDLAVLNLLFLKFK